MLNAVHEWKHALPPRQNFWYGKYHRMGGSALLKVITEMVIAFVHIQITFYLCMHEQLDIPDEVVSPGCRWFAYTNIRRWTRVITLLLCISCCILNTFRWYYSVLQVRKGHFATALLRFFFMISVKAENVVKHFSNTSTGIYGWE